MKVTLYAAAQGKEDKYELRTFEVNEKDFTAIQQIVSEFGKPANQDGNEIGPYITLEGKLYELSKDPIDRYKEIERILKKSYEVSVSVEGLNSEEENGLDPDFKPQESSEFSNSSPSLIHISFDEKKPSDEKTSEPATIESVIRDFLEKFNLELEAICNLKGSYLSLSNVKILAELPSLLERFKKDEFAKELKRVNSELDLSPYTESDKEKEKLLQKKKELEQQLRYVEAIANHINNAKRRHMQVALSPFAGNLGTINTERFNSDYEEVTEAFRQFKEIIEDQVDQIQSKLEKIEEEKLANSIVVRTWYGPEREDEKGREILGIPSDGHTTVELYKNKDERIYLGFYVCPNKDKSSVGDVFKKVGLPTPDPGKGYFVDLEYDRSLVGQGKKFARYETVVVKCDRPGAELGFDAAYEWAQSVKAKYPIIRQGRRQIQIINDYNFYNNNCASFGAEALRLAGAGEVIAYSGKTIINIDTPMGVCEYAKRLEGQLVENAKKHIEKIENQIIADSHKSLQEKYSRHIGLAVERLKLIPTDDRPLQPVLESLITQLFGAANKISELPDKEVMNYMDRLFIDLHTVINQFIEREVDCNEAIEILKHLLSIMPAQEQMFIKMINISIENNLHYYKSIHTGGGFGGFASSFLKMNDRVQLVRNTDNVNLFDKTLQIRTTAIQLNHLYQEAFKEFKNLQKENIKDPQKLKQIETHFKNLTDYYFDAEKQLRSALAELRLKLYFNLEEIGNPNTRLQALQKILLPPEIKIDQMTISNLLQNAKSENTWALPCNELHSIKEKDQKAILMKSLDPHVKAPDKPHVLAFWKWPERHQHFELENKSKIYQVVNNNQLSWKIKLQQINSLINDNKPHVLKFWRQAEHRRYDNMGAQASLICLIQAFSEAKLSEAQLVVEIEKIIPAMEKTKRQALIGFKDNLLVMYQSHIASSNKQIHPEREGDELVPSHARMLKKLLKTAANYTLAREETLESLGVALYAMRQYHELKEKNSSTNRNALFGKDNVSEAKQQVEIETALWRQLD
jgi:hypothetical protein